MGQVQRNLCRGSFANPRAFKPTFTKGAGLFSWLLSHLEPGKWPGCRKGRISTCSPPFQKEENLDTSQ